MAAMGLANLLLVVIVTYQLRTTPSDVKQQLLTESASLQIETEALRRAVIANQRELLERGPRIESLEKAINSRMQDRIHRREVQEWIDGARELNPGLKLPELPPGGSNE